MRIATYLFGMGFVAISGAMAAHFDVPTSYWLASFVPAVIGTTLMTLAQQSGR